MGELEEVILPGAPSLTTRSMYFDSEILVAGSSDERVRLYNWHHALKEALDPALDEKEYQEAHVIRIKEPNEISAVTIANGNLTRFVQTLYFFLLSLF